MQREFFFFTEMGYTAYDQDEAKRLGYNNLMYPNENFSPEKAQELYGMYFDELQYCTEAGFDGIDDQRASQQPAVHDAVGERHRLGAGLAHQAGQDRVPGQCPAHPRKPPSHRRGNRDDRHPVGRPRGLRVSCGASVRRAWPPTPTPSTTESASTRPTMSLSMPGPSPAPSVTRARHFHYRVVNPWVMPLAEAAPAHLDSGRGLAGVGHLGRQAPVSRMWRLRPSSAAAVRHLPALPGHRRGGRVDADARSTGGTRCVWPWPTPT